MSRPARRSSRLLGLALASALGGSALGLAPVTVAPLGGPVAAVAAPNPAPAQLLSIPDAAFRQYLVTAHLGSNRPAPPANVTVPDGYAHPIYSTDLPLLSAVSTMQLRTFGTNGPIVSQIRSLEGVAYLAGLTSVDVQSVPLRSVDLSRNTKLTNVRFDKSGLADGINVTDLTALRTLTLSDNDFRRLDLKTNKALVSLQSTPRIVTSGGVTGAAPGTGLTEIDTKNAKDLTYVNLAANPITSVDLTKNKALNEAVLTWTHVRTLDMSKMTDLTKVTASNMPYLTSANFERTALHTLYAGSNPALTSLNLAATPSLTRLDIAGSGLAGVALSQSPKLTHLAAAGAKLTTLDVSRNTALQQINADRNQLSALSVAGLSALTDLSVRSNALTSLVLGETPSWTSCTHRRTH